MFLISTIHLFTFYFLISIFIFSGVRRHSNCIARFEFSVCHDSYNILKIPCRKSSFNL